MLRCRRCRRGVIDSTCLLMVEDTGESSTSVCSIWHVNVDTLPEWILTSVHQAQWTVGKLHCQNCAARLGSFNFLQRSECPCGLEAAVHLNKSRVDRDHKHYVLIVQPRRTRPERGHGGLQLTDGSQTRPVLDASPGSPPENSQSFSFSPLYCLSQRRRCSLEDGATVRSSCFCPADPRDKSSLETLRTGVDQSSCSSVPYPTNQLFDPNGEASGVCRSYVSGSSRSHLDQRLLQAAEDEEYYPDTMAVHQDVSDPALFLRGRSVSDSVAQQDQDELPSAFMTSPDSTRMSKREKNRLKSVRRKQRRRERWLHSRQDQTDRDVSPSPLDSEGEDREGLSCAVCLDVYFSPYSCQPCAHVFCEPCLRTIAKNRPAHTPCPLCRAIISHTHFNKELDQTAMTFFPKVYNARKRNFQSASCAKWPLPCCPKRFRSFWGEHRRAAMAGRRWHFAHGGFTLGALDLNDMRGWLFDIGLVIVYIHSVNWILVLLLLSVLAYYLLFF